ncbi:MAG: GNAT family N-acetyltransferase [Bacteroidota bacterium]|nr:GNAT family N-acetyltransferase [Bacteroidota bacterium]
MNYLTEPLNSLHRKREFSCGKKILDDYFHTQAKQDVKRKLSACFVLAAEDNKVKGYYTLSSASINREILPENIIKKLPPSYQNLPATLLGRLAIDNNYKGQKLGELILIEALKRSYEVSLNSIGSMVVIVDPIDDEAIKFYSKYGFILLADSKKMFIPMETISELFV